MSVSPGRRAAFEVVRRTLAEGAYTDRALHAETRGLDARDRAFAKRLAFGTVQRRGTFDWITAQHTTRKRLDPEVRAALHLGLEQLLFLDGVADHAAIGESVELAKPNSGYKMVNAILRNVQRQGAELPSDEDPAGAAIRHSHPEWLVRRWWDWLGADATRALLAADNEPAELALRVNTLVPQDGVLDEIPGERVGETTIVVEGAFDAFAHPAWEAGAFMPQSRASQRVAAFLAPQPGERVLDLCSAPGGKTTHLAALMEGRGELVAVERHPGRATALERTCERMHAANVRVVTGDAVQFRDEAGFDRILLDPPCSGLGTLQSHPDLRWRVREHELSSLAAIQDALLLAARANLRPGGTIVFSVCTLNPGEERVTSAGAWRTFPSTDGTDGFYCSRDGG